MVIDQTCLLTTLPLSTIWTQISPLKPYKRKWNSLYYGILKGIYSNAHSMINYNSEIYSSCRHKTRFHRFPHNSTGTDDSTRGQKSSSPSPSSPEGTYSSICSSALSQYTLQMGLDLITTILLSILIPRLRRISNRTLHVI